MYKNADLSTNSYLLRHWRTFHFNIIRKQPLSSYPKPAV